MSSNSSSNDEYIKAARSGDKAKLRGVLEQMENEFRLNQEQDENKFRLILNIFLPVPYRKQIILKYR